MATLLINSQQIKVVETANQVSDSLRKFWLGNDEGFIILTKPSNHVIYINPKFLAGYSE